VIIHSEPDAETTEFLSCKVLPVSKVTVVYLASWASRFGQPVYPVPNINRKLKHKSHKGQIY